SNAGFGDDERHEHPPQDFRAASGDAPHETRAEHPKSRTRARAWQGADARVRRDRAATLLVGLLAAVAFSAALANLVAVWPGLHGLRSAAGSYAALADAALRGQSPGHDDGRSFLTTYYFPPFPLLIAAAK